MKPKKKKLKLYSGVRIPLPKQRSGAQSTKKGKRAYNRKKDKDIKWWEFITFDPWR